MLMSCMERWWSKLLREGGVQGRGRETGRDSDAG